MEVEERNKNPVMVDEEEVVSDMMLGHKEALLDEWTLADEIWELQMDLWARMCVICQIRDGGQVGHDWRDCPSHAGELCSM